MKFDSDTPRTPLSSSEYYTIDVECKTKSVFLRTPSCSYKIDLSDATPKEIEEKLTEIKEIAHEILQAPLTPPMGQQAILKKMDPVVVNLQERLQTLFSKEVIKEFTVEEVDTPLPSSSLPSFIPPSMTFSHSSSWNPNLLSHCLGDSFISSQSIQAKKLEGYSISAILPQALDALTSKKDVFYDSEELEKIQNALKIAIHTDQWQEGLIKVHQSSSSYDEQKNCKQRYCQELFQKFNDLEPEQELLIPGGWSGKSTGHSILYTIKKQEDGRFTMRVINAGAGAQFHSQKKIRREEEDFAFVKNKVLPILEAQDLLIENLLCEEAWQSHFEMMGAQTSASDAAYSAEDVYGRFLPLISKEFKTPSASEESDMYMGLQRAGTCSWKSFMGYLLVSFGKRAAKEVKHHIRVETLQHTLTHLQEMEKEWQSPELTLEQKKQLAHRNSEIVGFIEKSTEKFSRSIRKALEREKISFAEVNDTLLPLIEAIQTTCHTIKTESQELRSRQAPAHLIPNPGPLLVTFPSKKEGTAPIRSDKRTTELPTTSMHAYYTFTTLTEDWAPQASSITQDLTRIAEDVNKAWESSDTFGCKLELRKLFSTLPPPSLEERSIWKNLPSEEVEECLSLLTHLSDLYSQSLLFTVDADPQFFEDHVRLQKILAISHQLFTRSDAATQFDPIKMDTYLLTHKPHSGTAQRAFSTTEDPALELDLTHTLQYLYEVGTGQSFYCYRDEFKKSDIDLESTEETGSKDRNLVFNFLKKNPEVIEKIKKHLVALKEKEKAKEEISDAWILAFALSDLEGHYMPLAFCQLRKQAYLMSYAVNLRSTSECSRIKELVEDSATPPKICLKTKFNGFSERYSNELQFPQDTEISISYLKDFEDLQYREHLRNTLSDRLRKMSKLSYEEPTEQNSIICKTKSYSWDKVKTEGERELEQLLRTDDPSLQLAKIVQYCRKDVSRIQTTKAILKELLLERGVLRNALHDHPPNATLFRDFIAECIATCAEENERESHIFFLELSHTFERYCEHCIGISCKHESLEAIEQFFDESMAQFTSSTSEDSINRFEWSETQEFYLNIFLKEKEITPRNLKKILQAAIELSLQEESQKKNNAVRAVFRVICEYSKNPEVKEDISSILLEIAREKLPFPFAEDISLSWESFPLLTASDDSFAFDLQMGIMHMKDVDSLRPPSWLLYDRVFRELFPEKDKLSNIRTKGTTCSFLDKHGNETLAVFTVETTILGDPVIQIIKIIDGKEYIYQNESPQFLKSSGVYAFDNKHHLFTHHTKEGGRTCLFFEKGKGAPSLCFHEAEEKLEVIDPHDARYGCRLLPKRLLGLSHALFDDIDESWHGWLSEDSELMHIDLPSFTCSFSTEERKGKKVWVYTQDPSFFISDEQTHPLLGQLQGVIILENATGEKKLLVPDSKVEAKGFAGQVQVSQPEKNSWSKNEQELYTFDILSDDEISAPTVCGMIHLAYLFLSLKNYEKARDTLEKIKHILPSQEKEHLIPFRRKEMNTFDHLITPSPLNHDEHPFAIAIRLQAFCVLAQNLKNYESVRSLSQRLSIGELQPLYQMYLDRSANMGEFALSQKDEELLYSLLTENTYSKPLKKALEEKFKSIGRNLLIRDRDGSEKTSKLFYTFFSSPVMSDVFTPSQIEDIEFFPMIEDVSRPSTKRIKESFYLFYHILTHDPIESPRRKKLSALLSIWKIPIANKESVAFAAQFLTLVEKEPDFFKTQPKEKLLTYFDSYMNHRYGTREVVYPTTEGMSFIKEIEEKSSTLSFPKYKTFQRVEETALTLQEKKLYKPPLREKGEAIAPIELESSYKIDFCETLPLSSVELVPPDEEEAPSTLSSALEKIKSQATSALYVEQKFDQLLEDISTHSSDSVKTKIEINQEALEENKNLLLIDCKEKARLLQSMEEEILLLANSFEGIEDQTHKRLMLLGKTKDPLTLNNLLCLYGQSDAELFLQKNPSLSKEQIHALQTSLGNYLLIATQAQKQHRVLQKIEELQTALKKGIDPQGVEYENLAQTLYNTSAAQRSYTPEEHPEYLLFEYRCDMLLYPQQITSLEAYLEEGILSPLIQQMIMGAGKTKVLLPLRALKKANGHLLSVVMVPEALADTASKDLQIQPGGLFHQVAHRINWQDLSPAGLQNILSRLEEIRENKEFLIVTAKELHLFALRARENRLTFEPTPDKVASTESFRKILSLFKDYGDIIIDEIDQVLSPNQEVHIAYGDRQIISQNRHDLAALIYNCLHADSVKSQYSFEFMKETTETAIPYNAQEKKQLQGLLIQEILSVIQASPVGTHPLPDAVQELQKFYHSTYDTFTIEQKHEFIHAYLSKDLARVQASPIQYEILDPAIQDSLAVLKKEIHTVLPITLDRNHCEHYGIFEGELFSGPFQGVNRPKIGSEHGDYQEVENYTLQSYLKTGIPPHLIKQLYLQQLQKEAKAEGIKKSCSIKYTKTLQRLVQLCPDIPLDKLAVDLNTLNDGFVQAVTEQVNKNPLSIIEVCRKAILPELTMFTKRLGHNGYQLVDLFANVQGCTGTPWNEELLSDSFETKLSAQENGAIAQTLWKTSQDKILQTTKNDGEELLEELISSGDLSCFRALIDRGGVFKDLSNRRIAEKLLFQIKAIDHPDIEGVVYFEKNEMRILKENGDSIPFDSSHHSPHTYCTFYDQAHTVGSDIKHKTECEGWLTLNKNSKWRDLSQAAWRMRGLGKGQSIRMVLTPDLESVMRSTLAIPRGTPIDMSHFMAYTLTVQAQEILSFAPATTKKKLDNTLFSLCNSILQSIPIEELEKEYIRELDALFIHNLHDKPSHDYGSLDEVVETEEALNRYMRLVHEKIDTYLKKYSSQITDRTLFTPLEKLQTGLEAITQKAMGILPPQMTVQSTSSSDTSVETTSDTDREQSVKQTTEADREQEIFSEHYQEIDKALQHKKPLLHTPWLAVEEEGKEVMDRLELQPFSLERKMSSQEWAEHITETSRKGTVYSLSNLLETQVECPPYFDPEIFTTAQFIFTAHHYSPIGVTSKTVETVLVSYSPSSDDCSITLLSSDDAEEVYKALETPAVGEKTQFLYNPAYGVIRQNKGTSSPTILESEKFKRLILQIKLLNGELFFNDEERTLLVEFIQSKCTSKEEVEALENFIVKQVSGYRYRVRKGYPDSDLHSLFSHLKESLTPR